MRLAHVDALTAYLATSPGGLDSVAIIAASTPRVDLPFVLALQSVRLLVRHRLSAAAHAACGAIFTASATSAELICRPLQGDAAETRQTLLPASAAISSAPCPSTNADYPGAA
jgi:hypothetical protein